MPHPMGRKKIDIKKIDDEKTLLVTFAKRKVGLFNKACELSVLCNCKIAIIIFTNKKRLHHYASEDITSILSTYQECSKNTEIVTNKDIMRKRETKKLKNHSDRGLSSLDDKEFLDRRNESNSHIPIINTDRPGQQVPPCDGHMNMIPFCVNSPMNRFNYIATQGCATAPPEFASGIYSVPKCLPHYDLQSFSTLNQCHSTLPPSEIRQDVNVEENDFSSMAHNMEIDVKALPKLSPQLKPDVDHSSFSQFSSSVVDPVTPAADLNRTLLQPLPISMEDEAPDESAEPSVAALSHCSEPPSHSSACEMTAADGTSPCKDNDDTEMKKVPPKKSGASKIPRFNGPLLDVSRQNFDPGTSDDFHKFQAQHMKPNAIGEGFSTPNIPSKQIKGLNTSQSGPLAQSLNYGSLKNGLSTPVIRTLQPEYWTWNCLTASTVDPPPTSAISLKNSDAATGHNESSAPEVTASD